LLCLFFPPFLRQGFLFGSLFFLFLPDKLFLFQKVGRFGDNVTVMQVPYARLLVVGKNWFFLFRALHVNCKDTRGKIVVLFSSIVGE